MFVLVLAAAALFLALHLTCIALCAHALGIGVKLVSFGMGPALYSRGKLRLRLLPVSGYVKLKMAAEEEFEASGPGACFDTEPRWKRVLVLLSGVCGALLAASLVLGAGALDSLLVGFGQLVRGVLHPLSTGAATWSALAQWTAAQPVTVVLATLCCKLAAANLLPTMGSNGAQALLATLAPAGEQTRWERNVLPVLLLFTCVLMGGWLLALGWYLA